jgi:outer membrane receptor protein involved in Fe transport
MILLSPGTSITQYGESGIAPSMKIRGFSGSHGGDLAMYLDGIPLQDGGHADGYVDSNLIIPIEIESLEIIKGPASVYYGSRAAGGAMAYQSYKTGNFTRLNLRYGSYNEADATGIIAHSDDDLSQVYAFEVFHTDGFRDHSDWNRGNFSGRWTYDFTDKFSASLNLRAYNAEWNSAGYLYERLNLPKTAWVDDGSGEGDGGDRKRFDGRLWANYKLSDESQFTFYAFGTDLDNNRWQIDFPSTYTGPGTAIGANDGALQASSRKAYGTGLAYNFKGALGDHAANVTLGVDYLHENEKRDQYRLNWGSGRKRGDHYTDTDYILKTLSFYGEAGYQIMDPLQIRIGGRYDHLGGEMDTGPTHAASGGLRPNSHYDAKARGVFSPKAGLLLTPFDWLQVYTNYGRGFGLPGMNNGRFFAEDHFELTKREQIEFGFRASPADWVDLEMVYYNIDTSNDETYDQFAPLGQEWQNAGKTKRDGLETIVNFHPFEFWTLTGNYTYQRAKYKSYADANNILDGHRLTSVPTHITNLELAYAPEEGFGGRLNYRWEADSMGRDLPTYNKTGGKNLEPFKLQDKGTVDFQLSYKFNEKYKVTLDVLNLMDKDFYGSQGAPSATGDFSYSIQPPRTVYLGLDVNWE